MTRILRKRQGGFTPIELLTAATMPGEWAARSNRSRAGAFQRKEDRSR